jgi:hypothetical protein
VNQTLEKIAKVVVDVAQREDLILHPVGRGVLQIPELAFVYVAGREIALKAESIFGISNVPWLLERTINATSGRTDLVFVPDNQKSIAMEFKIDGGGDQYVADLKKLAAIDPEKYERVFCALMGTWPDVMDRDPRVKAVEEQPYIRVERLTKDERFDFFPTIHDRFRNPLYCMVALWRIVPSSTG